MSLTSSLIYRLPAASLNELLKGIKPEECPCYRQIEAEQAARNFREVARARFIGLSAPQFWKLYLFFDFVFYGDLLCFV